MTRLDIDRYQHNYKCANNVLSSNVNCTEYFYSSIVKRKSKSHDHDYSIVQHKLWRLQVVGLRHQMKFGRKIQEAACFQRRVLGAAFVALSSCFACLQPNGSWYRTSACRF